MNRLTIFIMAALTGAAQQITTEPNEPNEEMKVM